MTLPTEATPESWEILGLFQQLSQVDEGFNCLIQPSPLASPRAVEGK